MMAVFEKRRQDHLYIDDTNELYCCLKEPVNIDGHIEYSMEVWRSPDVELRWIVRHRYSDFTQLHSSLKVSPLLLPMLPPKKVFGNTDTDFINERKSLLQKYINDLLTIPILKSSLVLRKFLDPKNYSDDLIDSARQNVHLILRSGGSHEATDPLPGIGTRIHKQYFSSHPLSDPKTQHLLWWAPYGPDKSLHLQDIHNTLTALAHCQHPYIVTSVSSSATEAGVCVIRPFFPQGSFRDLIYISKPLSHHGLKYSNDKKVPVTIKSCATYGRQILQALQFLHDKNVGHGCLHLGNVVLDNKYCRLLDLENQVVGLPHPLRPFIINHRRINSIEAIDVYSFGHLLYELVFQTPLNSDTCDQFPVDCPPLCRSVLESILSSEACKNGLPTVAGLLTHPFFNEVPLHTHEKPSLRLSSSVKTTLATLHDATLARIAADHKKIRHQKKLSKAEAIISQQSYKTRNKKKSTIDTSPSLTNGSLTPDSELSTSRSSGATTPNSDVSSNLQ